jgi:uncharacterized caspase-like protein
MKTLALIIGNNDYTKNAKLENAINDANAISEVFKKLNYEIIFRQDCNADDYGEILTEVEEKITSFDAASGMP